MSLPELSINRHVLAYMLSGVIVLFGIVAYRALGVDRFPHIDFPIVSVTTTQPGANPEVIDASITNIIERQVNSVPGIDYIQSSSTPGVSQVIITFKLEKDIDVAFQEVQSKVSQVVADLPDDADPPVVAKVEADATPILWLHILGDRTLQQLNTFVTNTLRRQIETIDGVGDIRIGGLRDAQHPRRGSPGAPERARPDGAGRAGCVSQRAPAAARWLRHLAHAGAAAEARHRVPQPARAAEHGDRLPGRRRNPPVAGGRRHRRHGRLPASGAARRPVGGRHGHRQGDRRQHRGHRRRGQAAPENGNQSRSCRPASRFCRAPTTRCSSSRWSMRSRSI